MTLYLKSMTSCFCFFNMTETGFYMSKSCKYNIFPLHLNKMQSLNYITVNQPDCVAIFSGIIQINK